MIDKPNSFIFHVEDSVSHNMDLGFMDLAFNSWDGCW